MRDRTKKKKRKIHIDTRINDNYDHTNLDVRETMADEIQSSAHTPVQLSLDISVSLNANEDQVYDRDVHFPIEELC